MEQLDINRAFHNPDERRKLDPDASKWKGYMTFLFFMAIVIYLALCILS